MLIFIQHINLEIQGMCVEGEEVVKVYTYTVHKAEAVFLSTCSSQWMSVIPGPGPF